MDSILRKYGSLPIERKAKITEIKNSICLSPDYILNMGKDCFANLTLTLDDAAKIIETNLKDVDEETFTKNQETINKLSEINDDLENHIFAIEFFLQGKKTRDAFFDYHKLSLSEKIQFRNTQLLIDMLEEKSASLLKASILASQCKFQLIINGDILENVE